MPGKREEALKKKKEKKTLSTGSCVTYGSSAATEGFRQGALPRRPVIPRDEGRVLDVGAAHRLIAGAHGTRNAESKLGGGDLRFCTRIRINGPKLKDFATELFGVGQYFQQTKAARGQW